MAALDRQGVRDTLRTYVSLILYAIVLLMVVTVVAFRAKGASDLPTRCVHDRGRQRCEVGADLPLAATPFLHQRNFYGLTYLAFVSLVHIDVVLHHQCIHVKPTRQSNRDRPKWQGSLWQ